MIKHWLISIFFLFTSITLFSNVTADSVRFIGKAPDYAGYHIVFYQYSNFIIPQSSPIISIAIDKTGAFNFTFPVNETFYAYTDLGRFRAWIYLEPGLTYHLVLPPFEPKTEAQKLNPHFQAEEIPLGIANESARALNRNILEFNEDFELQYNTNAVALFVSGNTNQATKIENELEKKYTFNHPYFNAHKHFSYLKLWQMTLRRHDRQLINDYLSSHPVEFDLPVYWDAFKTLLSGFLPGKFAGSDNQNFIESIKTGTPFDSIIGILTTDTLFRNPVFAESVMLFTLFESYYNKSIDQNTALSITQSAITKASSNETRQIATQLFLKMSQLRPGSPAPSFALTDLNGKIKTLEDYSGKFVYLNFIHTKNHACLQDLQTIEQFEKTFKKELNIVSIVLDDNFEAMETFLKKNNRFNWDFLHFGSSPGILTDYNIKGVPLYYLIDPKGNLCLSPAPSPEENFSQLFIERYLEYQRSELRKNPPRERSIFKW